MVEHSNGYSFMTSYVSHRWLLIATFCCITLHVGSTSTIIKKNEKIQGFIEIQCNICNTKLSITKKPNLEMIKYFHILRVLWILMYFKCYIFLIYLLNLLKFRAPWFMKNGVQDWIIVECVARVKYTWGQVLQTVVTFSNVIHVWCKESKS